MKTVNNKRVSRRIAGLMAFSTFFLGLVIGMMVIHVKSQKDLKEVNDTLDEVIREQSAINVTNVYVPERDISEGKVAMNSYDTDNFRVYNGFMAYFDEDGNKISHLGCDLSYHNGDIDWDALKASGCEFVMLRIGYRGYTEGGLVEDEKFEEYLEGAKAAGLDVGVYFFTQSTTIEEAEDEADFVLELLDGVELEYPVAYDTEKVTNESARTNTEDIDDELRSQMCVAFCEKIKENGYYPMIYAAESWMRRDLDLEMLKEYDFWAPQYRAENDFLYDFTIWQYTEAGNIPGVEGEVDLDISMVDYASFVPAVREAYLTGGGVYESAKGEITITTSSSNHDEEADTDRSEDDDVTPGERYN